jgi:hypothetical protein
MVFAGIDPNHAGLIESSRRAAKVPNVKYVLGGWEDLPGPFAGRAERITVVFPWGSLLRAAMLCEPGFAERVRTTLEQGGELAVVTAIDSDADAGELARLGLEGSSAESQAERWQAAGFDVCLDSLPADHAYQTTWWRKTRQRPGRVPMLMTAALIPRPLLPGLGEGE